MTAGNTDYNLETTSPVAVANPSAPITLSAATDSEEEGVEVFEISILPDISTSSYTVGSPSKAIVYIRDVIAVTPTTPAPTLLPTGKPAFPSENAESI